MDFRQPFDQPAPQQQFVPQPYPQQYVQPVPAYRKPKIKGDIGDVLTAFANFILTFVLIHDVLWQNFSYITTVVYLLFFALATAYIVSKTKKFNKDAILPGACAILSSFSFALHTDEFNSVVFLLLIYLSGSYCVKLTGANKSKSGSWFYLLDVIFCEVFMPIARIHLPFGAFFRAFKNENKGEKKSKTALWIVLGIVLAIPVLIIILLLLTSSDIAFGNLFSGIGENIQKFFENFFENFEDNIFKFIFTFIPTCIVAPFILSVMFSFRYGITKEESKEHHSSFAKLRKAPDGLVIAFLSIISIVYLVYMFSQLSYLFSAFTGHLPDGSTISVTEYARSGFFELVKISIINFILIFLVTLFSKRKDSIIPKAQKLLCVFLSVFTIFISSTSIAKILLYINQYGLTRKRLLVFVADIVLIIVFTSLIIRLFAKNFPYMKVILSAVCISVTALGLAGINNVVMNYNCDAYLNGKISTVNFEDLSVNSVPLEKIITIAKSDDNDTGMSATEYLTNEITEYYYFTPLYEVVTDNQIVTNGTYTNLLPADFDFQNKIFKPLFDNYVSETSFRNIDQNKNKHSVLNNREYFEGLLKEYLING